MANDLSFNIVALDSASKTLDTVADRLESVIVQLNRIDGKTATADVNIRTDDSQKALDSFTSRFQLLVGAVVAASPLAGAAIVGGIGTAFIALAAAAEKSNQDVQVAYKNLWSNVVQTTRAGADQLAPQFIAAANAMDAEVQKLGPDIARAFSYAGPDIVALTRGVDTFAQNAMPGVTAAMANSLPVFQGAANAAGELGSDVGAALTSISQHATEYGVVVTSAGQITGAVVQGVVSLVNDMAGVWAQNGSVIVADVRGIVQVITDLGQGALPIVSGALHVAAEAVQAILAVLGPLAPVLGTVGGLAVTAFAAFKTAEAVTGGVNALANGVVTLAGNVEAGAVKAATFTASMLGVEAESSAAAGAITAAGAAAATAGTEMGIGLSALAGPIGIVVGLTAGVVALGSALLGTDGDTVQMSGHLDNLTSALERSHGAFDQAAQDALRAEPDFKKVAEAADQFGVSQNDVADAVTKGGGALDGLRAKLQQVIEAHKVMVTDETGASNWTGEFDATGQAAQNLIGALGGLAGEYGKASATAAQDAAQQHLAATALANSSQYQQAAAGTANLLGLGLGTVTAGYRSVIVAAGAADTSVGATSEAFIRQQLVIAQAATAMTDRFVQADRQVVQSTQAVADAQHAAEQAHRSVTDAQQGVANAAHSVEQAQRSLQDAYAGVTAAEQNYARAQQSARDAQVALNLAREKAIQDLKDLHLQLEDQVISEEQARVRLFDAQQAGADQGVTLDNAREIAARQVTAANEKQVKAAIDVMSAQSALNNALNSGDKLRTLVNDADRAGVNGAPGVISAQNALRSAQDQVTSSAAALERAHQQVRDAQWGVQQSSLGLERAHRQVTDAQYQQSRAAEQLRQATNNLRDTQDAASRSLDIHTAAGQQNLGMVLSLWDAIAKSGLPIQDQYRAAIDNVAGAFGISRDRAADYLKQLGLIPQDFRYSVTAVAGIDRASFEAWLKSTLSWDPSGETSRESRGLYRATGGPITGPGGPTDDMVPLWGSDGEYMQPAAAVDHYGVDFMEAVRTLQLPRGGDGVPGYAKGGMVSRAAQSAIVGASLGAAYLATNNARGVMGFPKMPDLPPYVPPVMGGGMIGYAPGAGVAQWTGQILTALTMLGQGAGWLGTVQRRMQQESGGNPTVVNRWDSNWARGTPSVGLMQVVGPTYAAYRGPNVGPWMYGVSVDPLSNIYAGLNYAVHRYGGLSALNRPGGYDAGGQLQPGYTLAYNGTGRPENVRTGAQEDALLTELRELRRVIAKRGNTYNMPVHNAANNEIDLKAQFQRMEIAAGML